MEHTYASHLGGLLGFRNLVQLLAARWPGWEVSPRNERLSLRDTRSRGASRWSERGALFIPVQRMLRFSTH
jgi:hypothetical protein